MLIDSGADVTLLPRYAVEQLNLSTQAAETVEIAGFDGKRTFAAVVYLDLVFEGRIYRGRYVVCDSFEGVLGRDVLNLLRLLLDGPHCEWQLSP